MKAQVMTEWFPATDRRKQADDPIVTGRMVEVDWNGKTLPMIEHRFEGGESPCRDISYTWAVPEKLSENQFIEITSRFPAVFEAYEKAKQNRAEEEARKEAEIEARIEAEVAARLAAEKAKPKAKKEVTSEE